MKIKTLALALMLSGAVAACSQNPQTHQAKDPAPQAPSSIMVSVWVLVFMGELLKVEIFGMVTLNYNAKTPGGRGSAR